MTTTTPSTDLLRRTKARLKTLQWRVLRNTGSWLGRVTAPPRSGPVVRRIVSDLRSDGIAITHIDELFSDPALYAELRAEIDELERKHEVQIAEAKANKDTVADEKTFLYSFLGSRPLLDPASVFVRVASQEPVLAVAERYSGVRMYLRSFALWRTFVSDADARRSQLWHRDPEDRFVVKMFIYLSDVDEGSGPFTYARGTHAYGRHLAVAPQMFVEEHKSGKRATDEAMFEVLPRERVLPCVGRAGTVIFADTRGFHKGGLARERERLLFTSMYLAPSARSLDDVERVPLPPDGLTPRQRRALSDPWRGRSG